MKFQWMKHILSFDVTATMAPKGIPSICAKYLDYFWVKREEREESFLHMWPKDMMFPGLVLIVYAQKWKEIFC